jgi:predicted CXXCH cytochrome family protein
MSRVTWAGLVVVLVALPWLGVAARAARTPAEAASGEPAYPHGKFQGDCAECHGDQGWKPARISRTFDHGKRSGFALSGAHAALPCTACHASLDFTQQKKLCASCHQDPHLGEFGADCARCHTARDFLDRAGMMRMHQLTRFPLSGAHAGLDCESCHPAAAQGHLRFTATDADCYGCHRADFAKTTNPGHAAAGFPTTCATCHTATAWQPARFKHTAGADCYGCHKADYEGAASPAHVAGGFPTACATCHNTVAWRPASFDHSVTPFALTGAHVARACTDCHGLPWRNQLATDCYSCHQAAFTATTAPAHVSSGIPTTCASCHGTVAWQPATFDHNATPFPLSGAHLQTRCIDCHGTPWVSTLATDCYSCHRANYDATNAPAHAASGIATTCTSCHNTAAWQPASFDHSTTPFPLTGAHVARACTDCHGTPWVNTPPTDCYGCHKAAYDATNNPAHAAAGFPTACATCHTTSTWSGATFDHTWFPITSGRHSGIACATCHTVATDYSSFSCTTGCHDKTSTDSHHGDVSGYQYSSPACYSCHPRGSAG